MRSSSVLQVLGVVGVIAAMSSPAAAQPVASPDAGASIETAPTAAAPTPTAPAAAAPSPAVDDAAWSALEGRKVSVDTSSGGTVTGELLRSDGDTLVLVQDDGTVRTLPKAQATGVRVVQTPTATPTPTPVSPAPATTTTSTPPPTNDPAPAMGNLDPAPAGPAPASDDATAAEGEEELTPGQKRRKERREKREHALLGAFTMQGATYSHWRGDGVKAGHASYAMDFGIGANLSPGFGMYAVGGGLFGAKIDDPKIKANYGHFAALFAFGGKYYYSTVGAGVALSRLRFADGTLDRDRGLALPFKLVGKIPLPKKLYIGLGLTYEFAAVRGFSRFVNAIGGQIVFGRW